MEYIDKISTDAFLLNYNKDIVKACGKLEDIWTCLDDRTVSAELINGLYTPWTKYKQVNLKPYNHTPTT